MFLFTFHKMYAMIKKNDGKIVEMRKEQWSRKKSDGPTWWRTRYAR